jgi:septum formation protein
MYTRWLPFINSKNVILASGSQQRKLTLSELGIKFESKPSEFPEDLPKTTPRDYVQNTCFKKFEEFLLKNTDMNIDILISADTIVVHNATILEKPNDDSEIYNWLSKYSNDKVTVHTSVVIGFIKKENGEHKIIKSNQFITSTLIYFSEISEEMICDYIKTGEPYNKAGGFAIQGYGKTFIEKIEGCYYNVTGFPVQEFTKKLVDLLEEIYGKKGYNNVK